MTGLCLAGGGLLGEISLVMPAARATCCTARFAGRQHSGGRDRLLPDWAVSNLPGFKVENRFMRARLALFKRRDRKHHVSLE
ncbi:hypothetical protein KCP74_17790 [Salmonella enterica subsp. enterica]|nr:hypothetical protein KCP74_17790 [Salmonella enterica subsp. enterica]